MNSSQLMAIRTVVRAMVARVRGSASSRTVARKRRRPASRATRKASDQTMRWASTSSGTTWATALKYTGAQPHHRKAEAP